MSPAAAARILAVGDPFIPAGAFTRALAALGGAVTVTKVQIADARAAAPRTESAGHHVLLVHGAPATAEVLAALHDIGYGGWLTVEASGNTLPNPAAAAAATKIWRKLFDSEDELAADAYRFLAENWERTAPAGAAS